MRITHLTWKLEPPCCVCMPCVLCVVCFTPSSLAGNGTDGFFIDGGDKKMVFGVGDSNRAAALTEAAAATGGAEADIKLVSVKAQERGKLPRT